MAKCFTCPSFRHKTGRHLYAIDLRLGANIVEEHKCICGTLVDRNGIHGLSCRRSNGRFSRHQAANKTIRRALVSGGVPLILDPYVGRMPSGLME